MVPVPAFFPDPEKPATGTSGTWSPARVPRGGPPGTSSAGVRTATGGSVPSPCVNGREQHPYPSPHACPAHLSLQGFMIDTATRFRRLTGHEHRHAQACHHIGRALVSMAMIMPGIVAGHVFGSDSFLNHNWNLRVPG